MRLCSECEAVSLRRRALALETGLVEHRLATLFDRPGLEGHLAGGATLGADGIMHLAVRAIVLASGSAVLAALWGAQVLGCIKLLFTIGERKCLAAIAAYELLVSHKRKKKEEIE